MADGDERPSAYRERVYAAFADRSLGVEAAIQRGLEIGCERLGVEFGFLARIADGTRTIVRSTGTHERIRPGETCPLDEAYCRRTIETDGPLSVRDAGESEAIANGAYDASWLGCYVGSEVVRGEEVYGTVCFADPEPREREFDGDELAFVGLIARLVGQGLGRRDHEGETRRHGSAPREEEGWFRAIVEANLDIIFRIETDGSFEYVSPAVERHLGYRPGALIGEPVAEYITDDSLPAAMAAFERILDGEPVEGLELEFPRRDGDAAILEVNVTPVVEDGDVVMAQGAARDITDRKDREEELRLKDRAIDAAELGVTIIDVTRPGEPIVHVNDRFASTTGYDKDELLGRPRTFLQGEATDEEAIETIRNAIETGTAASVELVNYRRIGVPFWDYLTLAPVANGDGEVTHYVGLHQDVTERKRTERLLDVLNRILRHNIRNDLNIILGYSTSFEGRAESDAERAATSITDAGENLLNIANRARELEQLTDRAYEPAEHDPDVLLRRVAGAYRGTFPEATIDVSVDTEDRFRADPDFDRAIAELVENALVHDDSPPTNVRLTARTDGNYIEITVRDDGPGIPRDQAVVVELGRETPLEHSLGLGLWITNWITTKYGGSFQIRSVEADGETGTVGTFRLPTTSSMTSPGSFDIRPATLFW